MHHSGPFSIPAINNYVPEKLKPWIFILIVVIFQFSGGLYLATSNEMIGATALMQEDILMAGFASLIGMALTFTIMLRLKMRFTSKFSLITCALALIVANIICMHTNNIIVLVATCFFAGVFKMWATFECNSTIQLWLTPKRDLGIFFCYIYLLVQSCILLSGITNLYVALFANWEYMHWFVIGSLLFVILMVVTIFNNNRFMRPFPLLGIDWLGAFMWGLILLDINFILIYGEHYDWWYSWQIKTATIFLIVLSVLNAWRASFIRHPFIALQTFGYKAVYMTFLIYAIVDIFIAPAHLVEHAYYEGILGYDSNHIVSTNWMGWLGVVTGAVFTYFYFAKNKNSYKSTFLIGFGSILIYLILMYFIIDYNTSKSMLAAPLFFRNFGYVAIAIALLTNLIKVPFIHFFQALSVQAFISAGIGSAIGTAILHHFFSGIATKNFQLISSNIDRVNHKAMSIDPSQMAAMIQQQVMMVSFKELYGYMVIAGLAFFIVFILYRYPHLPTYALYPKMNTIVKNLRKQLPSKAKAKVEA